MQIRTKSTMYRLLLRGRFGNYQRAWNSLADVLASDYRGLVSIRSQQVSNPVRVYHVPQHELADRVAALPEWARATGLMFCEAPPDQYRTIQGEYDGFHLTYSHLPLPMRLAFDADRRSAYGPEARWLLRGHIGNDVDHLDDLLADFPDATVEFSGFRVPVGVMRRRILIWEVRHY